MDDPKLALWNHFRSLEDPRAEGRNKRHSLQNIVVLAVVGFACGMKSFEAVAEFCEMQKASLEEVLDLRYGIPSHDTFRRVFETLEPEEFERRFSSWANALRVKPTGEMLEVVPIDGKTIRNSGNSEQRAVHLVSAWAQARGLILGQVAAEEKSNEITAIPILLETLRLEGCIVTIDAMGCQKTIAKAIVEKGAHYQLSLKENQPTLLGEVKTFFDSFIDNPSTDVKFDFHEASDKGHGRLETRRCWTTGDVEWLENRSDWESLNSFVRIDSERTIRGKKSVETRYFISSRPGASADEALYAARAHWQIENNLHWSLDVTFGEDRACLRDRTLAENTSVCRRLAMNALRVHPDFNSRKIKGSPAKATRAAAFDLNFRKNLIVKIASNA